MRAPYLKFLSCMMAVIFPAALFAADHPAAMVYSHGTALLNGTRPQRADENRPDRAALPSPAPALALLAILTVAGVSLGSAIQVIIFVEGASLGFWGFVAGRRAGLSGWPLARTVVAGLIVGLLVLALQLFLEPGHASLKA